jgi:DNA-binding response OmpR family regulator
VFLTAKATPEDRQSSLAAGADDYITKPVDLDELLGVVSSWATRGRLQRTDGAAAAASEQWEGQRP